jgi:hypothetical protein
MSRVAFSAAACVEKNSGVSGLEEGCLCLSNQKYLRGPHLRQLSRVQHGWRAGSRGAARLIEGQWKDGLASQPGGRGRPLRCGAQGVVNEY